MGAVIPLDKNVIISMPLGEIYSHLRYNYYAFDYRTRLKITCMVSLSQNKDGLEGISTDAIISCLCTQKINIFGSISNIGRK